MPKSIWGPGAIEACAEVYPDIQIGGARDEIRPVESDLDALSIAVDFISAIAAERNIIAGLNVSRAAERLPEAIENALALVGHGDESRRWIMLAFERADALYEQIRLVLDGLDSEPAA
mgnify:CR=1 FL=1